MTIRKHRRLRPGAFLILLAPKCAAALLCLETPPMARIAEPPAGRYYLGVFPGGQNGMGSDITPEQVESFRRAAGKRAAWVYFWHNWYEGSAFPLRTATWIRETGSVPYVRLMLLSAASIPKPDPHYTLDNILAGKFDKELRDWMREARLFGSPLIAEYGVEVNGNWFPWNGLHNRGKGSYADAVGKFRQAYRHIVSIAREQEARNIRWVFHVDPWDEPEERWNRFENYYPGDDWIDWVGVSVYGRQLPSDPYIPTFRYQMDWAYGRLRKITRKPVIVCEFGTIREPAQAAWTRAAFEDLLGDRWPGVIGFCWWNANFFNDRKSGRHSNMRLEDSPALARVFRRYVAGSPQVLGEAMPAGPQQSGGAGGGTRQ